MTRALWLDIEQLVRLGACPDDPMFRAVHEGALAAGDLDAADFLTTRDLAAQCDGGAGSDPAVHALLLALFRARARGSTCLDLQAGALTRALDFAGDEARAAELAAQALALLNGPNLDAIVAHIDGFAQDPAYRPLVCVREHGSCRTLAFQKFDAADRVLARAIAARLPCAPPAPPESAAGALKQVIGSTGKFRLGEDQQLALALALARNFCVITGGPGTGKTTIVASLLRLFVALGIAPDRIRLAAPTGRAAKRMAESLRAAAAAMGDGSAPAAPGQLEAATLHRLLAYSPSRHAFEHDALNPLSASVVIVDEASMIDSVLMTRLIEAAGECERLILIGDHDQLPSVEAGSVLSALVGGDTDPARASQTRDAIMRLLQNPDEELVKRLECGAVGGYTVRLGRTHRYDRPIADAAAHVNALEPDALLDALRKQGHVIAAGDGLAKCDEGVWFVRMDEEHMEQSIGCLVEAWGRGRMLPGGCGEAATRDAGYLEKIFAWLNRSRVLTVTHGGPAGRIAANRVLAGVLAKSTGGRAGGGVAEGTPVMISRNDYGRGLFNGDVGVVLRTVAGQRRAFFDQPEGHMSFALDELPDWTPAFATTVHKSQGSEFESVLVLLPDRDDHPMLTCEILYTALTRAKRLVVIAGTEAALRRAAATRIRRDSNLARGLAL